MAVNAPRKRCCGELDLSQFGRCMHCVVLATMLTVLSWTGFFVVRQNFPSPWLSATVMIFSCLFSLLLLAHAIAFFGKREKQ